MGFSPPAPVAHAAPSSREDACRAAHRVMECQVRGIEGARCGLSAGLLLASRQLPRSVAVCRYKVFTVRHTSRQALSILVPPTPHAHARPRRQRRPGGWEGEGGLRARPEAFRGPHSHTNYHVGPMPPRKRRHRVKLAKNGRFPSFSGSDGGALVRAAHCALLPPLSGNRRFEPFLARRKIVCAQMGCPETRGGAVGRRWRLGQHKQKTYVLELPPS